MMEWTLAWNVMVELLVCRAAEQWKGRGSTILQCNMGRQMRVEGRLGRSWCAVKTEKAIVYQISSMLFSRVIMFEIGQSSRYS